MTLIGTGTTRHAYELAGGRVLKVARADIGDVGRLANLFEFAVWTMLRDTDQAANIAPVLGLYDGGRALVQRRVTDADGGVDPAELPPGGFAAALWCQKIAGNFGRLEGRACIYDYGSFNAVRIAARFDPLEAGKAAPR